MGSEFELRVLEALDAALEWPEGERAARLAALEQADPALGRRLRALLGADGVAGQALPTLPPAPAAAVPTPPARIGVYRLAALLGEGGMGAVWRGERDDGLFEQSVAVKLMRPSLHAAAALAQFATERRVLARLRHPNIAQLFDGGADAEGRAYFIMELVDGVPITEHVARHRLPPRQVAALLLPVCAAVQHAHQALVVHADIKPGNILVDAEGRPKLLDFGIARNLADQAAVPGQGLTPGYASPQQRAGGSATPADDIHALGILLRELASGQPPGAVPPAPLRPGFDAEYAAIIAKAAVAEPGARYESAGALAADLRRWIARRPVQALPPGTARSLRHLLRRRPWAVTAVSIGLVGLVVALAVISTLYLRAEQERREADQGFARARGMAQYMLFDLFDRLNDTPGTLPVRRDLAERARAYLEELSETPRATAELRAEAAIGTMQLAGIQGLFAAGALGERQQAEASLARAAALLDAAGPADRDHPLWRYAEGRLRMFQGFRVLDQGAGAAAAQALLREAVAMLRQAAAALPDNAEVATDLWQAQLTLADTLGALRQPAAQQALAQQTLADYAANQALLDRAGKTPLLLGRSHGMIGDARYAQQGAAAALGSYREADAILTAEDARHPRRSRTLMELMNARWNLASVLGELGEGAAALAQYERSIGQLRERLLLEPDHDGLQRMANLLELERAGLLAGLGRGAEALAAATADLAARRVRMEARPGDQVAWRGYLAGLRPAGDVAWLADQRPVACRWYQEAQDGYAAFMARFALAPRIVAGELADIASKLARCRP
ncbi:MAG TPA: serine/threonine-protein kinase [Roseomonas sp.]|jgi:serine/threonine-protein kinase